MATDDLDVNNIDTGDDAAAIGGDEGVFSEEALSDEAGGDDGEGDGFDADLDLADDSDGKESNDETDDDLKGLDLTTELLSDLDDEEKPEGSKDEDAGDRQTGSKPNFDDRLQRMEKLMEELNATTDKGERFKRFRDIVNTALKTQTEEVKTLKQYSSYGDMEKVAKAVELYDDLYENYDVRQGAVSTERFAEKIATSDANLAKNLVLHLLSQKDPKTGRYFADIFTEETLGISMERLQDFQAISKGEVPPGYEGFEDILQEMQIVPAEYQEAYKLLSPKVRQIVLDGYEEGASNADAAEAERLLTEAKAKIDAKKQAEQSEVAKQQEAMAAIDRIADEVTNDSTSFLISNISRSLDRLTFAADPSVDAAIKGGLSTQLFGLAHETVAMREQAEAYFKSLGVTVNRPELNKWFANLSEAADAEVIARSRNDKTGSVRFAAKRREAERELRRIAVTYISKAAQTIGGKLSQKPNGKLPEGQLPGGRTQAPHLSTNNERRPLTPQQILEMAEKKAASAG